MFHMFSYHQDPDSHSRPLVKPVTSPDPMFYRNMWLWICSYVMYIYHANIAEKAMQLLEKEIQDGNKERFDLGGSEHILD
jgi:hypothetical protein